MIRKNIILTKKTWERYDIIEQIFRSHHPELNGIPLSKEKLTYEMQKYYIKTEPKFKHLIDGDEKR